MLLFYENEPDATESLRTPSITEVAHVQAIDSLPQYESHKFIPYQPESEHKSSSPSSSTTVSSAVHLEQPLTLHNASTWTYSGPLLPSNTSALPPSFHTWASATISRPSILLERLLPLLSFLQAFL